MKLKKIEEYSKDEIFKEFKDELEPFKNKVLEVLDKYETTTFPDVGSVQRYIEKSDFDNVATDISKIYFWEKYLKK